MKNVIKYLRRSKEFDVTQQELADAIGVSRQTIIAIEQGKNTSDEIMIKLANFFDRDPREIFFIEDVVNSVQSGFEG